MAYTLQCLGFTLSEELFEQALADLLDRTVQDADVVGHANGTTSFRWTDPSGARLTVGANGDELAFLVPSCAGETGVLLADLIPARETFVYADVLVGGELATRMLVDLEQARHVPAPESGILSATLVALGVAASVHADAAAFATSEASLLGGGRPGPRARVDSDDEPMRFAAESFLSYGVFGKARVAEPKAFMAGVVRTGETRTNRLTTIPFHVLDVGVLGFSATVCLPVDEHPVCPVPGNVVAGEFYLVASADALWSVQPEPPKRRRLWRDRHR